MRDGRIVLTAPVNGVVSEIGVREGQAAPTGTLLFRVNGTDTVWLEAAIPQAAVGAIVSGTPVEARVSTMPGRVFEGRVETLLPQIETSSRSEEHTSELQSLMRISYAVFCLKKKKKEHQTDYVIGQR